MCQDSRVVHENPQSGAEVACFEGVGKGLSYDGQYGYVRRTSEYGNYYTPTGVIVQREMIRNRPESGSRDSPVYHKRSQRLKYLALGPEYSIYPEFNRFIYGQVRSINFRDGSNIAQVRLKPKHQ